MKHAKVWSSCLLGLFLVCGSLGAWDLNKGHLVEWDISPFSPRDIEILSDGTTWLIGFDPDQGVEALMKFDYLTDKRESYDFLAAAEFRTMDGAADDTLWIADFYDRLVHFDPATETFDEHPLDPAVFNLPAGPHEVTVASDGSVWFTCWDDRCLGRFVPATGAFERYAPDPPGELPATPVAIAFDQFHSAWFTMMGAPGTSGVGKYDPDAGDFTEWWLDPDFVAPYGITKVYNEIWFLDPSAGLLCSIDLFTNEKEKIPLPPELENPWYLVGDREGTIWITAHDSGAIGTYDLNLHEFDHRYLEDSDAHPTGIAASPYGRICWAEGYGGVGCFFVDPRTALFSPRTQVAYNQVYLDDPDLGGFYPDTPGIMPSHFGSHLNLDTLNAVDRLKTSFAFWAYSVREDQLLYAHHSGYVYVKKSDVISTSPASISILFRGSDYNVPGIDAVTMMEDGRVIFSPDDSFFHYSYARGPCYIHDEDLAVYDPGTGELKKFFTGKDYGITSLDAVELYGCSLFFSVRDPVFITCVPQPFYLEDGDVAGIDLVTGQFELKFKGSQTGVYDLDALSLMPVRYYFGPLPTGGQAFGK